MRVLGRLCAIERLQVPVLPSERPALDLDAVRPLGVQDQGAQDLEAVAAPARTG